MTLLAIDPGRSAKGEASIGYAIFTDKGEEVEREQVNYEDLRKHLRISRPLEFYGFPINEVVCEDFVNNDRSRGGQTNGTSECIGMVEYACYLTGTPFTRQSPAVLAAAKLHAPAGSYRPLKHLRHEDSAFLHGFEFLVRRGDIKVDLSATLPGK